MSQFKVRIKAKPFLTILAKQQMSQTSFGRWAKITSGHMSQLLTGKRNVSPRTRKKILEALPGVHFEQIFANSFKKKR